MSGLTNSMILLLVLGASAVAAGSVLNNCEYTSTNLEMDGWPDERSFFYVKVADDKEDKFAICLMPQRANGNRVILRLILLDSKLI